MRGPYARGGGKVIRGKREEVGLRHPRQGRSAAVRFGAGWNQVHGASPFSPRSL